MDFDESLRQNMNSRHAMPLSVYGYSVVVYFDQQTGASHTTRSKWSLSSFSSFSNHYLVKEAETGDFAQWTACKTPVYW